MVINDFCVKSKILNFKEVKLKVLSIIDEMGIYSYINRLQNISNTDFHIQHLITKRPYIDVLKNSFDLHLTKINQEFDLPRFKVDSFWFQQYEKDSFHSWHNHPNTTFTNIAFIELPDKKTSTIIKFKNQEYQIDVSEGEILSFPGFFVHSSPVNKSGRKTVVVLNSQHFSL